MPVHSFVSDGFGRFAQLAQPTDIDPVGLVVYSEPRKVSTGETRFFVNDTYGSAMNQNVTFGGTPEGIYNGGDSVLWTASALSGTWDFTSSAQAHTGSQSVDATATVNNSTALFSDTGSIAMTGYVAMTGWIYITGWSTSGTKDVTTIARNAGVNQGNSVNLSAYIDTTLFNTWQKFVIPIGDMGLSTQTIDELTVTTVDIGAGQSPNYYLDDMQWEQTGRPEEFVLSASGGEILDVNAITFSMADGLTGSYPNNISYDKFMNLSALTNGVGFRLVQNNTTSFNAGFTDISDFLILPRTTISNGFADGTNTFITISVNLSLESLLLDGRTDDKMIVTIQDDLSGLLRFQTTARLDVQNIR